MYRCVHHYVIQCWSKTLSKAFTWHYLRCVLLLSRCSCQDNCAVAIARQCPYETSATVCSRMSGRERSWRQLSHRKDYVSPIKYHWFPYTYPANIYLQLCVFIINALFPFLVFTSAAAVIFTFLSRTGRAVMLNSKQWRSRNLHCH